MRAHKVVDRSHRLAHSASARGSALVLLVMVTLLSSASGCHLFGLNVVDCETEADCPLGMQCTTRGCWYAGDPLEPPTGDGGAIDLDAGPAPDGGPPSDGGLMLAPPVIDQPGEGDEVGLRFAITGTGQPGARFNVEVFERDDNGTVGAPIETASGIIYDNGVLEAAVDLGVVDDTSMPLRLVVTQSRGELVSPEVTVDVNLQLYAIEGTVVESVVTPQIDTDIIVRLYAWQPATLPQLNVHPLDWIYEARAAIGADVTTFNGTYEFLVGAGEYLVVAFRDITGAPAGGPNNHPTLTPSFELVDPQGVARVTLTDADTVVTPIVLSSSDLPPPAYYETFNVRTVHASYEARPPSNENGQPGEGLCQGYFMFAEATLGPFETAAAASVSTPWIRNSRGADYEMLDDGACGSEADNTGQSYDYVDDDSVFAVGFPDPDDSFAGDYVLYYQNNNGHIHSQVDHVSQVRRLSRRVDLLSPSPSGVVSASEPIVLAPRDANTWVDGYVFQEGPPGRDLYIDPTSDGTAVLREIVDGGPLNDDQPIGFAFRLFDALPFTLEVDAEAYASVVFRYVDADQNTSVVATGEVTDPNDLGAGVEVLAAGSVAGTPQVVTTAWLPEVTSGGTPYAIRVPQASSIRLIAGLDHDGRLDVVDHGQDYPMVSRSFVADGPLDAGAADISFPLLMSVTAPAANTTVSPSPVFSWPQPPGTEGVTTTFLLSAQPATEWSVPPVLIAVSNADLAAGAPVEVDLAALPDDALDLYAFLVCEANGGTYSRTGGCPIEGLQTSLTSLSTSEPWHWSVGVVDCDFSFWTDSIEGVQRTFGFCVGDAFYADDGYVTRSIPTPFFTAE